MHSISLIGQREACPLGEAAGAATRRSEDPVQDVAFSPDGKFLPTAGADHTTAVEPAVDLLGHTGMQDRQPQSVDDGVERVCSSMSDL